MQRNHKVAVIEIAEKTGDIIDMVDILSMQRIPLGARHINGSFDVLSLRKWWSGRGIPASRSGLERALETLQVPYAELLLVKCSGLSLSDQYWVTPCDAPQSWHAVNFYENGFSEDVGRALFGEGVLSAQPDLCSPCNTSDGFLQKRWRIADGKRILLKAGSGIYQQEPYNELVATELYDSLGSFAGRTVGVNGWLKVVLQLTHHRLGAPLVALDGQACGLPFGFAFAVISFVGQYHIVDTIFFLQMPCDHKKIPPSVWVAPDLLLTRTA